MEHGNNETQKIYDMSNVGGYYEDREVKESEKQKTARVFPSEDNSLSQRSPEPKMERDESVHSESDENIPQQTPQEEKSLPEKPQNIQRKNEFDLESSTARALENMIFFKKEEESENKNAGGLSLQLKLDNEKLTEEISQIIKTTVSTELQTTVINTINDNLQSFSDTKEWSEQVVSSLEKINEHAEIEQSKFREWIKKENRITILSLITIAILFGSGFISGWKLKSKITTYNALITNAYNKKLERELDERWNQEQENIRKEAEKIIEDARKRSQKLIEDASKKTTELQAQELRDEVREKTKTVRNE